MSELGATGDTAAHCRQAAIHAWRRKPGWTSMEADSSAHTAAVSIAIHSTDSDSDSASRCLTIWQAMWRLGILPVRTSQCPSAGNESTGRLLCVYILGAQAEKEGRNPDHSQRIFGKLQTLLGWNDPPESGLPLELRLVLCGPEVGTVLHVEPAASEGIHGHSDDCTAQGRCKLTFQYIPGYFHEVSPDILAALPAPDLVVCFQPGFWGYESWELTVRTVLCTLRTPLLITSYSWEEADDDCGQLEEWGIPEGPANSHTCDTSASSCASSHQILYRWGGWAWELEPNPYASQRVVRRVLPRFTDEAEQHIIPQQNSEATPDQENVCDNHHWQCILPPGTHDLWPVTEKN